MLELRDDEPLAVATVEAIRSGDLEKLNHLLTERPDLIGARIESGRKECGGRWTARSLLHVATDWPGHFPNNVSIVAALISRGADVNAPFIGPHKETPLHWAASSDDVEVIDALLDHGADIEAPGSVIDGGTALADAVAFGQWRAARRLLERGARTLLWQAAALGLVDRMRQHFFGDTAPGSAGITRAFWCACHGGQREAAEYLLKRGADINWIGYDGLTPLDAAARTGAEDLVHWLSGRGGKSSKDREANS